MERCEVEIICFEIEHSAGISPEFHGTFLTMGDCTPCFDYIFLLVGHIMQNHINRIFVVGKAYDGLCSAFYALLFMALVIQVCSHIAVGMGHGKSRLKELLIA